MKRIREPELMIDPDQAKAYAESDFSISDKMMVSTLVDFVKKSGGNINASSVILDLGCGPGNITERIASHWPNATVTGIDDSFEMLKVARKRKILDKKLSKLEGFSYIKTNISAIGRGASMFFESADLVVSNSLMHHIHDFSDFLRALKSVSKKGALHFHRDLRRPSTKQEALAIQKKYIPDASPLMMRDFMASLNAAYTAKEIKNKLEHSVFKNFEVLEIDDRYVDVFGIIPISC
ncbi:MULTISPECIES: class I SAM-dependent methyltransferase [unclassified Prochlorococcus]|uniref:class I SAM-dependent methyltransferase n=1 Tax=unclassified Prochlorococcus TaxID=2627481 RepID=UPI0005337539|nr:MULTISPECIES: class I SAM-dependent methyltransferase [unclassified Prochlorococcus]KGG15133.1 SAM-dependent methyltransferase [Prochlorococcus sp. MIT 0602]KGG17405.1 SAM-dependent methyltransferase [Prochlorococcus sp. MIT 0603]